MRFYSESADQRLLCPGQAYSVGRRDDDKSVSRQHATFTVKHRKKDSSIMNVLDPTKRSIVVLRDEGAKYGTFVNGSKIPPKRPYELQDNDSVKFGTLTSVWRLTWHPVVICCSGLRSSEKENIYSAALRLGKPTEKALLAIADLCPIIATSWIDKIEEDKDSTDFRLPAINEHQPPYSTICDSLSQKPNFLPMPRRRKILTDMTFYVFSEQQFNRMYPLVSKCQGEITYCKFGSHPWHNKDSIQQVIAKDSKSVLIFPPSESDEDYDAYQSKWKDLFSASQKLGERLIAEVEVGWAIVFGSTEAYCNKYASDPIESSMAFSVAPRDSLEPQTQAKSTAPDNPSTLTSEASTGIVRPQEPIPPSWVLGRVTADDDVAVSEENLPAINAKRSVAERTEDPIGNDSDAIQRSRPRVPKHKLNDFFDAMFDDLDDGPVETTTRSGASVKAKTSNEIAAMSSHSAPAESSQAMPRRAAMNKTLNLDDASSILDPIIDDEIEMDEELDQAANEIQQRYGSEKLQEINDRAYISSDEEVNTMTANNDQPQHRQTHDPAVVVEEEAEDEASISAAIEKQKKSLKASMKRSQEQALEQDNSFVTNPSEHYTTIVVKNLIRPNTARPQQPEIEPQTNVVNYKRFRKAQHQQPSNDMSYIRMLPHDQIHSAVQEVYWLQQNQPQSTGNRPGSQGGEKLMFD
ncbi:hypothetical protein INT43_005738 [Umbelopsis isabellina]|uniref:FHA domain-containing protein n=1 Tax=Mortierella isabellina TaxID=91625 RepID=A0A8H7UE28_MORIS|nr:hypothetical protein INT43_005738 [Umbelopsis isabellina]